MKNVKNPINGKGIFVAALTGASLPEGINALALISDVLMHAEWGGFYKMSRKGWAVMAHPILGQVSWKRGADFRSAKPFLFVRVNGREVIHAWPKPGRSVVDDAGFVSGWLE